MLWASSNPNKDYKIKIEDGNLSINGEILGWDLKAINDKLYCLISDEKVYQIELIIYHPENKLFELKVNGTLHKIKIKSETDILLEKLGMKGKGNVKHETITAPMPGLILDLLIKEGDPIKKGEPLLILEAMKMENVIKSPINGTVKKVNVHKGLNVEKNQTLIEF